LGDEALKEGYDEEQIAKDIPEELSEFRPIVSRMLRKDPLMRPSLEVILRYPVFEPFLQSNPMIVRRNSMKWKGTTSFGGFLRRELDSVNIEECAKLFAKCLRDETRFKTYFTPDDDVREKAMTGLFRVLTEFCMTHGHSAWGLFSQSKLQGGALWFPPQAGKRKATIKGVFQYAWNAKADLPGMKRYFQYFKKATQFYNELVPEPHWLLLYIVIDPPVQGKQLGEFLLQPVLEWADSNQQVCVSVTAEERPVNFLMKLGFEVICRTVMEHPFIVLKRKPQALLEQ